MMDSPHDVALLDLVAPLAKTADMMDAAVADHNMLVAYLALRLCEELGMPTEECHAVVVAGVLHDVGAFSLGERLDLFRFELDDPGQHAMAGYLLLRGFPPFENAANLVRFHHVPWLDGRGAESAGAPVPRGSHIIHLADRIAVQLPQDRSGLARVPAIIETVAGARGRLFVPELVDAAKALAGRDHVWLEAASGAGEQMVRSSLAGVTQSIGLGDLADFARLVCRLIDFKSEFTATHSSGVVVTAVRLAGLLGFSPEDCRNMEIAAYLHDVGKLAVPLEILEKPARLDAGEWPLMRSHVFHTHRALDAIDVFHAIAPWSALHHERLDGTGYPFRYSEDEIPLGARVMAAADVFTGITEDRPYREGMSEAQAREVLTSMAREGALDREVVDVLLAHYEEMNQLRTERQKEAAREFRAFQVALHEA